MLSVLSRFDPVTAAGILARTAIAIGNDTNPAATARLPEEHALREAVLLEMRRSLNVAPDDSSQETLERISDALDVEGDRLIGPTDEDSTLIHLSEKGELPSDLYEVEIIINIEQFHGRKFPHEARLIREAVKTPDREQHFGPLEKVGEPALISLFAKFFPNEYPLRGFTMLVAGRRRGMILDVHQAWRVYADLVDLTRADTLVDMLRSFSNRFGAEIKLGGQIGTFIYAAEIPRDTPVSTSFEMSERDKYGKVRAKRHITVTCFVSTPPEGALATVALAVGIDLDLYREALQQRGW
jgi:hypothetical protein